MSATWRAFTRSVRTVDADASSDDIEGVRNELVEDFATGRITVTSTPSREVAFMFIAADKIAATLATSFSFGVARAPAGREYVLPDMGITMYDPTPRFPGSGAGFASSPNVESVLPVDPSFAIVVMPGPLGWADAEIDEEVVDEVNLRSYAWSQAAVYDQSQKVVTDLRRLARRKSVGVARFKPRRGRLWIAEGDEGKKTGELEFVGHSPEGQTRARLVVHPEAYDDDVKYPG
jgi:hypothetical protein